jgi:hypothetical protein
MRTFRVLVFIMLGICGIRAGSVARSAAAEPGGGGENTAVLHGTVSDAEGRPLADAKLNAVALSHRPKHDPRAGSTMATVLGATTTDSRGRFQITIRRTHAPPDIALELFAYHSGHGLAFQYLDLERERYDVELRLPAPVAVSGRAVDPAGGPLNGASIKVITIRTTKEGADHAYPFSAPPDKLTAWPEGATSEQDGAFTLQGIGPESEMVVEIDDERVALQRWTIAVGVDTKHVLLQTEPSRKVEGQVSFRDSGSPVPDASVAITSWEDGQFIGSHVIRTNSVGRFSIRPHKSNWLEIRAAADAVDYKPLKRRIPWPEGTTTQRMFLPLDEKGFVRLDGTTPDGRPASTIEADYPTAEVVRCRPERPIEGKLSGSFVAVASFTTNKQSGAKEVSGLIAIDPETGHWRTLAENGISPRLSPDGRHLCYQRTDRPGLFLAPVARLADAQCLIPQRVESTTWGSDGESLVANLNVPRQRDYHGEEYWGQELEKWKIDRKGAKLSKISVPALYGVFDQSHDGKWIAMHWDTHSDVTAAQLFIARPDGQELRPVARKQFQYYWFPRFSPDDKTLSALHLDVKTGERSIRLIAVDGSQERSITLNDEQGPEIACWSPDGRYLAIAAYHNVAFKGGRKSGPLVIVNEQGTAFRKLQLRDVDEYRISDVDWTAADLLSD